MHTVWDDKMRKKGPMCRKRNASALEKRLMRIRTGVSALNSHYIAFKALSTSGNSTDEYIEISGSVSRFCALDVYDAIRTDRQKMQAR